MNAVPERLDLMETRFVAPLSQMTVPPTANDKSVAKPKTLDHISEQLQSMED